MVFWLDRFQHLGVVGFKRERTLGEYVGRGWGSGGVQEEGSEIE